MMLKLLEWDSEFFGINIASFDADFNEIETQSLVDYAKKSNIKLIQSLVESSQHNKTVFLENLGFHFIDFRVTLEIDLTRIKIHEQEENIRVAQVKDIAKLKKISFELVENSRFNGFMNSIMIWRFYQIWAEKAVYAKFDDACSVILDSENQIKGFISSRYRNDTSHIGLLAILNGQQKKSYGSKLLHSFFNDSIKNNCLKGIVVTEGKNIDAINFYMKNGFKIKKIESWYYKKIF